MCNCKPLCDSSLCTHTLGIITNLFYLFTQPQISSKIKSICTDISYTFQHLNSFDLSICTFACIHSDTVIHTYNSFDPDLNSFAPGESHEKEKSGGHSFCKKMFGNVNRRPQILLCIKENSKSGKKCSQGPHVPSDKYLYKAQSFTSLRRKKLVWYKFHHHFLYFSWFFCGYTQCIWHGEIRGLMVSCVKLKVILQSRGQSKLHMRCWMKVWRFNQRNCKPHLNWGEESGWKVIIVH